MLFQILSRNNDTSGNPYRLMLCYDSEGTVTAAYEARSSSPNKAQELRKTHQELPSFHLAPGEYNQTRLVFTHLIERAD